MQWLTHAISAEEAIAPYLQQLVISANQHHVSDIHIEPQKHQCRVRFRKDGLLHEVSTLSINATQRLTHTLKLMAQLNITEKRIPQDGRLYIDDIEIRLSTCPTLYGEKIAMRLQPTPHAIPDLTQLGMNNSQLQLFMTLLNEPQGLILLTGPTGSGKTMTLYSALQYLNKPTVNIVSIEDPIEIALENINQVNLNTHLGFDFPTVLRTILRQDPDIMMIGEIRDTETAQLASTAAKTGHLVLSSLHTHHSRQAIHRLTSLGITPDQIDDSLKLVIAQRLLRRLCTHPHHRNNTPCPHCIDGYQGRLGIFELLDCRNPAHPTIDFSLQQAGIEKVQAQETTEQELQRVLSIT